MTFILAIVFFFFGLSMGSFLNVIIFRLNTGRSFGGRSKCLSCQKTLSWYELVPVASFILQGRRCRSCRAKLSWQYPAVELLSGLIFAGLFLRFTNLFYFGSALDFSVTYAFCAIIFSLLLLIAAYDLRHKVIPDIPVFILIALSFAGLFLFSGGSFHLHFPAWQEFLYGLLFTLPFAALWFISRGKWMGLGDGKLALGLAWFLGPSIMFSALALSFWSGAGIGLIMVAFKKLHGLKSEIPFAPFLFFGAILAFFFQLNFFPSGF